MDLRGKLGVTLPCHWKRQWRSFVVWMSPSVPQCVRYPSRWNIMRLSHIHEMNSIRNSEVVWHRPSVRRYRVLFGHWFLSCVQDSPTSFSRSPQNKCNQVQPFDEELTSAVAHFGTCHTVGNHRILHTIWNRPNSLFPNRSFPGTQVSSVDKHQLPRLRWMVDVSKFYLPLVCATSRRTSFFFCDRKLFSSARNTTFLPNRVPYFYLTELCVYSHPNCGLTRNLTFFGCHSFTGGFHFICSQRKKLYWRCLLRLNWGWFAWNVNWDVSRWKVSQWNPHDIRIDVFLPDAKNLEKRNLVANVDVKTNIHARRL